MKNLHFSWDMIQEDQPIDGIRRKVVRGEKAMVGRISLAAGSIVPAHSHENEQIACVESGRLLFTVGDDETEIEVKAGEVLVLPSNIKHSALAAEDTVVIDVFSPPADQMGIDQ